MYLTWGQLERALEAHEGLAQVVRVRRSRLGPAAVQIAIILRAPGGGYTLRRMVCSGDDLASAREHLFDPDPETLAHGGAPAAPRSVQDHRYPTLAGALLASRTQDPAADQRKWLDASEFRSEFPPAGLGPKAEDVRPLGCLVSLAGALAVVAGVLFVLGVFLDLVGGDVDKEWGDLVVAMGLLLFSGAAVYIGAVLVVLFKNRNLSGKGDR